MSINDFFYWESFHCKMRLFKVYSDAQKYFSLISKGRGAVIKRGTVGEEYWQTSKQRLFSLVFMPCAPSASWVVPEMTVLRKLSS